MHGVREEPPPRLTRIVYVLTLWTDEPEARIDRLDRNLRKYGTIFNTLANSCEVTGEIKVMQPVSTPSEKPALQADAWSPE